jgi:ATP-dependent DNA helicase RecG
LRRDGRILQAAVVLFGKKFLPDYPQCELRMARFRGKDKTEFLDQRQVRAPAFELLEEAELFCQRHFPLPGKIVSGKLQRVDTPLIPPDAMREILVNAIVHRDYSVAGGAISLAVFDDRVEVWSAGTYPSGITPDMLSRDHQSVQRNPIIADVFFRAGLIEKWGRGTNRVIEMCKAAGVSSPEFEEISGAAVVRFRVNVLGPQQVGTKLRPETQPELRPESQPESLDMRVLRLLRSGPFSKAELSARLGQKGVSGQLNKIIRSLLAKRQIEHTIPDKPNSRLQKYRLKASR